MSNKGDKKQTKKKPIGELMSEYFDRLYDSQDWKFQRAMNEMMLADLDSNPLGLIKINWDIKKELKSTD